MSHIQSDTLLEHYLVKYYVGQSRYHFQQLIVIILRFTDLNLQVLFQICLVDKHNSRLILFFAGSLPALEVCPFVYVVHWISEIKWELWLIILTIETIEGL